MLRTAVRRAPRRSVGRSTRRVAKTRRLAKARRLKTSAMQKPAFAPRIEAFLHNLEAYINLRKRQYSVADTLYKKLNTHYSQLKRETRKKNMLSPVMARKLCMIAPALRGAPNLPLALRGGAVTKLGNHIREQVRKEIIKCLNNLKKLIAPMQAELNRIEQQVQSQKRRMKRSKVQWTIDLAIKRRIVALNAALTRFRAKWFRHLNTLSLNANKNVQTQIKSLKNQIDQLQKTVRKHQTFVNRHAKPVRHKPGYRTQMIVTANHTKGIENKWNHIESEFEKKRIPVQQFFDHLKAIKAF